MRVVIADDELLLREGVAQLLRAAGIDVVATVGNADELMLRVARARPDVALIDIRMPPTHREEGLVAAQAIRADHPATGVLVLSHYVDSTYAMRLLEHHPERSGYLLKERVSDVAVLVDALQRIDEGECVIDPTIVAQLLRKPRAEGPLDALTPREREVLAAMAEGCSNNAIAERLYLSPKTVEANIHQILGKLGITETPDLNRRVVAVLTYLRSA
ncbi:MAG: response regulator transcription factor [Actinomycetota bacterium]|nr:response regulator transcription factor [Actinomycetota bacterium]